MELRKRVEDRHSPESVDEVSVFLAIIAMRAKSGDSDLGRYRGEYVLKVQGPKGESVLRGKVEGLLHGLAALSPAKMG